MLLELMNDVLMVISGRCIQVFSTNLGYFTRLTPTPDKHLKFVRHEKELLWPVSPCCDLVVMAWLELRELLYAKWKLVKFSNDDLCWCEHVSASIQSANSRAQWPEICFVIFVVKSRQFSKVQEIRGQWYCQWWLTLHPEDYRKHTMQCLRG